MISIKKLKPSLRNIGQKRIYFYIKLEFVVCGQFGALHFRVITFLEVILLQHYPFNINFSLFFRKYL